MTHFSNNNLFLNKVRRAFGGALLKTASKEAQDPQQLPCSWSPVCGSDLLFREQMRIQRDGLPKPYVLLCEPVGANLLLSIRLFGLATQWAPALADSMTLALRETLLQSRINPGLEGVDIIGRYMKSEPCQKPMQMTGTQDVCLRIISSVDYSATDILHDPYSLLTRGVRRLDGMLRWHGLALERDWAMRLAEQAQGFDYDVSGLVKKSIRRESGRQRQSFKDIVLTGALLIRGDFQDWNIIFPLLESCFIGRGAVDGRGRVQFSVSQE